LQVRDGGQVPQSIMLPQPSGMTPQLPPGTHFHGQQPPQTFGLPPPPHVEGHGQMPQSSVSPHAVTTTPQSAPRSAQVCGLRQVKQTFGLPPAPQLAGAVHSPQSRTLPQPAL
jgi:hypothetical protein